MPKNDEFIWKELCAVALSCCRISSSVFCAGCYGFGWRMSKEHPGMYFHYGWWKGYRSAVIRDESRNRFLALLCNTTYNCSPDPIWEFMCDTSVQLPEAEALEQ